jgi:hypothetical protein
MCGTPADGTGTELRIAAGDITAVRLWQTTKRLQSTTQDIRLTMAFNGVGAKNLLDGLTLTSRLNQAEFYWVNHTYDHENLDAISSSLATWEIVENNKVAKDLGLSRWNAGNIVTPEISGLGNASFLQAAYAAGIRTLVSDTSRPGQNNPSPNAGLYNAVEPRLFMIPRRPNNLFFNVATPSDWTAEYNCLYESFWKKKLSYAEIVDFESQQLLTYMLQGDMDPWMFHQANMKAYSLGRTLLTDLLDDTLAKYNTYFRLPVLSPSMQQVAELMQQRMALDASKVSATRYPGSLSITVERPAVVPITGAAIQGAEVYGGQSIARVQLKAGQTISVAMP